MLLGGNNLFNTHVAFLSLALCCSKFIKPTNHYHSVYYLILAQYKYTLCCMKYFCMHRRLIIFHLIISLFYLLYHNNYKKLYKSKDHPSTFVYYLVAFCKMEFCFYLEKQWSGLNLTNRTICYGLDIYCIAGFSCGQKYLQN